MRTLMFLILAACWSVLPLLGQATPPAAPPVAATPRSYDPTDHYQTRLLNGWTVLINQSLLAQPELATAAVREMDHQLYQVERRVPAKALAHLKTVPIWLELNDPGVAAGVYHPNIDWLRTHGYNPAKAKCVEFGNAHNFLDWSLDQPFMVLHELAHAYHDQVLGYNHLGIAVAYRAAVDSRRYESVLHFRGDRQRHYALTNNQEFFAEMTEAFFGTNDFYPFVRAELKTYDPQTYRTIADAWGLKVDAATTPAPTPTTAATLPASAAMPAGPPKPPTPSTAATPSTPASNLDQDGPGLYRVSAGPGGRFSQNVRAKSREDAINIGLQTVARRAMAHDENVNINELHVEKIGP